MSRTSILSGRQSGFPFFFPVLFGGGADGALTLVTTADVGYLGTYGTKQATTATLAAGQTLTIGQGTSSGALIIAAQSKITIAGTITGDGATGGNASSSGDVSGAGGASAGGGAGGAALAVEAVGNPGVNPTKFGHGAGCQIAPTLGRGGGSGGEILVGASAVGSNWAAPALSNSATYSAYNAQGRGLFHSSNMVAYSPAPLVAVAGTTAANGTTQAINPTTGDIGPWAQSTSGLWLPRDYIPGGPGGVGGGVTLGGASENAGGGGGGGGGGVVIIEANTIELTAGYAINLRGGNGGNGLVAGNAAKAGGGSGGWGGICILICRTLIGSTAAINLNGGTAGTGNGTSAVNGIAGLAGALYVIKV